MGIGLIFAVIFLGAIIGSIILASKKRRYGNKKNIGYFIFAGVMAIAFIFIPFGFAEIKTGEIAVVKVWGKAVEIKDAGLHFRNVISTEYEIYDLKTQEITEIIEAYSLDAQVMKASIAIQYSIMPDKVLEINAKYGSLSILNNRLNAICMEKAKVVLSAKSAMNLIETRSQLSTAVETSIRENTSSYYVSITMVAITDITFNDAFETAVENKMIAEQEKLKAEYDKEKAIIKAEEEYEVAKKRAEAEIEKAKGDAQAQIEIAKAQAEAINIRALEIARMMGFEISEENEIIMEGQSDEKIKAISDYLKYIEYLNTWDGKLPYTYVAGDSDTGIIISP